MITHIELSGFKSIEHMSLDMRPLNVLIGANGAGKSNLLNFLDLLSRLADRRLRWYVKESGSANAILFGGSKRTQEISFRVDFDEDPILGKCYYGATLRYAQGDVLYFAEERYGTEQEQEVDLGSGHDESQLVESPQPINNNLLQLLGSMRLFHFVDTTPLAAIRQHHRVSELASLRSHGGNLAVVLHRLRQSARQYYNRILITIRQILPWFHDFVFEEVSSDQSTVSLRWRDEDPEHVFTAHQLPDGALRAIALITLLLQPDSQLPATIAIDEPELGLHPYAKVIVAGLLKQASQRGQVLIATQSSFLLDQFEPDDIVVVENEEGRSHFFRHSAAEFAEWLDEYSMSDLWYKNVIGGTP